MSLIVASVAWVACAAYLGLATRLPIVGDVDASTWAKWGHVVASMFVAALVYLLIADTGRPRRDAVIGALVITVGAGALLEVLQAVAGTRDPTVIDVVFDTMGALLAVALLSSPLLSVQAWTRVVTVVVAVMVVVVVPTAIFATPDDDTPSCDLQPTALDDARAASTGTGSTGSTAAPVASYEFDEGSGSTVADVSGVDPALDLRLSDSKVEWIDGGGLRFDGGVAESGAARKVTEAVEASGELTVEAWVRTGDLDQTGPARIVSISDGTQYHQVNVHLGQEGSDLSVRLRTTCGDFTAATVPKVFRSTSEVLHVAATFADGVERVYVQGKNVGAWRLDGRIDKWDPTFPLLVGNEATRDRPFDGSVFGVTLSDQAWSSADIARAAETPPTGS
jgi:hypothetical protein